MVRELCVVLSSSVFVVRCCVSLMAVFVACVAFVVRGLFVGAMCRCC